MKESSSKSENTRQFIIEKTAPVFNAKGFAGTSFADLTEVTGVSKGGIYGHFEGKDEIALAAFDYNFGRVNAYLKERILAKENAVERLLVYPKVYRDFLTIPFLKPGCPILNTSTEADDTHPALRKKAQEALAYWKKSIENQIKRGIGRKEIKSSTNAGEVSILITSLIEGAVMQAKVIGKSADLRVAMDWLEKMIRDLKV
jgi:TetR/AcrR family transcriptional repressor of nem operon